MEITKLSFIVTKSKNIKTTIEKPNLVWHDNWQPEGVLSQKYRFRAIYDEY